MFRLSSLLALKLQNKRKSKKVFKVKTRSKKRRAEIEKILPLVGRLLATHGAAAYSHRKKQIMLKRMQVLGKDRTFKLADHLDHSTVGWHMEANKIAIQLNKYDTFYASDEAQIQVISKFLYKAGKKLCVVFHEEHKRDEILKEVSEPKHMRYALTHMKFSSLKIDKCKLDKLVPRLPNMNVPAALGDDEEVYESIQLQNIDKEEFLAQIDRVDAIHYQINQVKDEIKALKEAIGKDWGKTDLVTELVKLEDYRITNSMEMNKILDRLNECVIFYANKLGHLTMIKKFMYTARPVFVEEKDPKRHNLMAHGKLKRLRVQLLI